MNLEAALSIYPHKLKDKKIKVGEEKRERRSCVKDTLGYLHFGRIDFDLKRKYKDRASPVTCVFLRDRDARVHHQTGPGPPSMAAQSPREPQSTVPPFLLIVSVEAMLREALPVQQLCVEKLTCRLCPNRNQPTSYVLHKQIILF